MSVFGVSAAMEDLTLTDQSADYVYGDLSDFNLITVDRAHSFKAGSINAPSGILGFTDGYKSGFSAPEGFNKYDHPIGEYLLVTNFEIDGNTVLNGFFGKAIGTFKGDVEITGTITREQMETYATPGSVSKLLPGTFFAGGSYHLGGVVVEGDLKASMVQVGAHQGAYVPPEYTENGRNVGGLIVKGNVEADWLIADIATPSSQTYDNNTDYIEIQGDAHIKNDVYTGGQINVGGKLTVDGTLYNAFGKYVYTPELGSSEKVEGLQPPDYVATTAKELDAKNIVNASNIFVGRLTNSENQVYTQTYGTIRVTDNWFKDSIINMSGGVIDEQSLGPDKNLGVNNVFNVSGGTL